VGISERNAFFLNRTQFHIFSLPPKLIQTFSLPTLQVQGTLFIYIRSNFFYIKLYVLKYNAYELNYLNYHVKDEKYVRKLNKFIYTCICKNLIKLLDGRTRIINF
jgi:hypothetical protein